MFELQQVVDAYDFHRQQLASIDAELQQYLSARPTREPVGEAAVKIDTSPLPAEQRKKMNKKLRRRGNKRTIGRPSI